MNTKQSVAQLAVPHRKRLSSTMVVALLLCVVAGAVMINAADFPATAIETDPGASAFPTFYACALIVLAVLLVIRDLLQAKPASCANAQEKPGIQENGNRNCGNRILYCGDELLRLSHYYSCFPHRHYDVDGLQAMGTHTGYCAAVNGNPLVAVCRSVTGAIACRHIFRITGASNV